jgi:hypothetical protein
MRAVSVVPTPAWSAHRDVDAAPTVSVLLTRRGRRRGRNARSVGNTDTRTEPNGASRESLACWRLAHAWPEISSLCQSRAKLGPSSGQENAWEIIGPNSGQTWPKSGVMQHSVTRRSTLSTSVRTTGFNSPPQTRDASAPRESRSGQLATLSELDWPVNGI